MEFRIIIISICVIIDEAKCLTGEWHTINEFSYFLSGEKLTYSLAVQHCREMQAGIVNDGSIILSLLTEHYPNSTDVFAWTNDCRVINQVGNHGTLQECASSQWHFVCKRGEWFEFRQFSYFLPGEAQTWNGSVDYCENMNASLVTIGSPDENEFVHSTFRRSIGNLWIGFIPGNWRCTCQDPTICSECRNSWVWYNGVVVSYTAWASNEPNTFYERCGEMIGSGQWNDNTCESKRYFLCKLALLNDTCEANSCAFASTCEVTSDDVYRCICPPGVTGVYCEFQIDECESDPCLHGGICHDKTARFECFCPQGYTGIHCEEGQDSNNQGGQVTSPARNDMHDQITHNIFTPAILTRETEDRDHQSTTTRYSPPITNSGDKTVSNSSNDIGLNEVDLYLTIAVAVLAVLSIAAMIVAVTSLVKMRKIGKREQSADSKYESPDVGSVGYESVQHSTYQGMVSEDYIQPQPIQQQHSSGRSNLARY